MSDKAQTIAFVLEGRNSDWLTDGQQHAFAPVEHEGLSVSVTKYDTRSLNLLLKGFRDEPVAVQLLLGNQRGAVEIILSGTASGIVARINGDFAGEILLEPAPTLVPPQDA